MDHDELLEPDLLVELFNESIDLHIASHRYARTPEVRRVDAVADTIKVDAARGHRLVDVDQLFEAFTDPVAPARTVLKDQQRAVVAERNTVENLFHCHGNATDASGDTRPHV